jgi:hypothetical protein
MKYEVKQSRASRSTVRKIERALARGWKPGAGSVSEFARGKSSKNQIQSRAYLHY